MKNFCLAIIIIIASNITYGQLRFEKILPFGEYQKNWALVEEDVYFGFIDKEGKEVGKPEIKMK
tara:strand:+ start:18653 stop:18844 length:192 start_codon:yes stop_codon:yes gene_type:complete